MIFGCGAGGRDALPLVATRATVLGFVDNDPARQHTTVLGHQVFPPAALKTLRFDTIYIASIDSAAIRAQLTTSLGIDPARIKPAPMAERPSTLAGPNTLAGYLDTGYAEIAGWLNMPAVEATLTLGEVQAAHIAPGPICEIGVWEGRYLTLLSFLPATPQRVLGIDPFIHGGDRAAQIARLGRNIDRFARRPDLVTLFERDSAHVTRDEILAAVGAPCQFVSVDGDHLVDGAMRDLHLAESMLAPGGIVAVDDFPNMGCPGVTEAVVRYAMAAPEGLGPFLQVSNKLFMTQRDYTERYRAAILQRARAGQTGEWGRKVVRHRTHMANIKVPVLFLGEELLVST